MSKREAAMRRAMPSLAHLVYGPEPGGVRTLKPGKLMYQHTGPLRVDNGLGVFRVDAGDDLSVDVTPELAEAAEWWVFKLPDGSLCFMPKRNPA